MSYMRSVTVAAFSFLSAAIVGSACSQQVSTSQLNFTYGANNFSSTTIKQGFDPAKANKTSDPISSNSLSVGVTASVSASNGLAVGDQAQVGSGAVGGTAIGALAHSNANGALAIGANTTANTNNGVALGSGSVTGAADGGWAGTTIGSVYITSNTLDANAVVSVSGNGINRQIQGIADGSITAKSTDAVNGSQLYQVIQALSTQTNGTSNVPVASDNIKNLQKPSVASGTNGLALGNGASTTGQNSVALGNGSTDEGRSNVVSVGSSNQSRQVVNVSSGTMENDAVNVSQLQPVVSALGGGASINSATGNVTNPTYTIAGTNYHDVGSALSATNNRIDQVNRTVRALASTVADQQKEYREGIASTTAIANLPLGTTPGKISTAVSFGSFQGITALAAGIQSNLVDSARMKLRATASMVPGSNNFTFGGGVGMEF